MYGADLTVGLRVHIRVVLTFVGNTIPKWYGTSWHSKHPTNALAKVYDNEDSSTLAKLSRV